MTTSNTQRVYEALASGEALTAKQITARYGLANPRAAISALRMEGYPIYLNSRKDTKGRTTKWYRMGTPTRRVIAAGYKALAMGIVV